MKYDPLSETEMAFLSDAKVFLENESLTMRIANTVGKPMVWAQEMLPDRISKSVQKVVDKSLKGALEVALKTVEKSQNQNWDDAIHGSNKSRILHSTMTGLAGGLGGFFGEVGLVFELPITTALMMRNIANIASEFGFCKSNPATPLECLYVFTLGSKKSKSDDDLDSAYFSTRYALSTAMKQGAEFLAKNSARVVLDNINAGTAPTILNFINKVATYFEVVVTEKMLAEALPVVGSVGGAAVNIAFTEHFGRAAKYHFGMLGLEQKYGRNLVEELYRNKDLKREKAA
ncbi:MAG: EcsC family protein [Bdellovibrionia bacterium]